MTDINIVELGPDSPTLDLPNTFKKPLRDYQLADAYRIIELQKTRKVKVTDYRDYGQEYILSSSTCYLSEPYGAGKSVIILCVIAACPKAEMLPRIANNIEKDFKYYQMDILVTYKRILDQSIIIVGSNVIKQWEQTVREFTNLNVFVICDKRSMIEFVKIFNESMHGIDLVVVKNGIVSWEGRNRALLEVLNEEIKGAAFQWAFYDDYETIKSVAKKNMFVVGSLFSVLVSATNNITRHIRDNTFALSSTVLHDPTCLINDLAQEYFNVRSTKEFRAKSIRLPIYNYYRCDFEHKESMQLNILDAIEDDNTKDILEALHGDSIEHAANLLGIKTNSINDIFQNILNKKFNAYHRSHRAIENINRLRVYLDTLPNLDVLEYEEYLDNLKNVLETFNVEDFDKFCKNIKYATKRLTRVIFTIETKELEIKKSSLGSINNIKDKLKDKECPICCMEYEGIIITKCCNLAICSNCLNNGFRIKRDNNGNIMGTCANCPAKLNLKTDIIYVSDIPVDEILNANINIDENSLINGISGEMSEEMIDMSPKMKAVLDIVNGAIPECAEIIENDIINLLPGEIDLPKPADLPKKTVIYTMHEESIDNIYKILVSESKHVIKLGYHFSDIDKNLTRFREYKGSAILLVNSHISSTGLNIQFADNLIFFQKIKNKNIEGQIAGRLHRIGREYNLKIFLLNYN